MYLIEFTEFKELFLTKNTVDLQRPIFCSNTVVHSQLT